MKKRNLNLVISILALAAAYQTGQARPSSVRVENIPDLESKFRTDQVWNGADGALSIPLGGKRNLWLFGDTFIRQAEKNAPSRVMVRNTAAIQDLSRSEEPFKFYWRKGGSGNPTDLLATPPLKGQSVSHDWYWPGAGIKYGGRLYLIMKRVRSTDSGPPEFRFDWYRDDLIVVENPDDEPSNWKITSHVLPEAGKLLFGVAALKDREYFYVYCSVSGRKSPMHQHPTAVARISLSALARSRFDDWQFYAQSNSTDSDGVWSKTASKIKILLTDGAPEMSVDRWGEGFVAVYQPPLSPTIMIRRALTPQGPFSPAYAAYRCPETDLKAAGRNVLVYAAKAHPELSQKEDELVVTYCVNPGPLEAHAERPDLYFPRCLKITEDDN